MHTHSAPGIADLIMEILSISPDVIYKRIYYAWNIIKADPDDNKFFDTAVAGNVDYLITNDAHFNDVSRLEFPKVNTINADHFLKILENYPQ